MTPTQIAELHKEFDAAYDEHTPTDIFSNYIHYDQDLKFRGYVIARTQQAKEIEALKATISDLTPLAKFGAEVAHHVDGLGAISSKVVWSIATRVGVLTDDGSEYTSNVGPTIETLLDDQYTAPVALTKQQQCMLGPITAADITSEMHAEWNKVFGSDISSPCPNDSEVMAAAICAYLKFVNL
jgi:hypothetical protein